MITGVVTGARQAVVPLVLSASDQSTVEVEAVIDTGYNGFVTAPVELIERVGMPLLGRVRAALGDSSKVPMAAYEATVLWGEEEHQVVVLAAEGVPLIGMAMVEGNRITIEVEEDGAVTIEALATAPS